MTSERPVQAGAPLAGPAPERTAEAGREPTAYWPRPGNAGPLHGDSTGDGGSSAPAGPPFFSPGAGWRFVKIVAVVSLCLMLYRCGSVFTHLIFAIPQ